MIEAERSFRLLISLVVLECYDFVLHQQLLSVLSNDFEPFLQVLEWYMALSAFDAFNIGDIRLIDENNGENFHYVHLL